MLLAAVPGEVGDGARRTVTNFSGATIRSVDTYVGKKLGEKRLRRFLVGPKECEITGITETPDGRAIFVNIQHPGAASSGCRYLYPITATPPTTGHHALSPPPVRPRRPGTALSTARAGMVRGRP